MPILLAALLLSAAPEPVRLQSLTPTSGENVQLLLDGKVETGWSPLGDARAEGVLFRFEKSMELDGVEVTTCAGAEEVQLQPSFNGQPHIDYFLKAKKPERLTVPPEVTRSLRSVFLRIEEGRGTTCLAEVAFFRKGQRVEVQPPRTVTGRVTASSVLTPKDAYHPAYAFDGRLDFGWVEGVDGPGVGESLTVELDQPATVSAIELWNGYQRSSDHFAKNARAKQLSFGVTGQPGATVSVADKMGPQKLALAAPVTGKSFTLKVLDAIKGSQYQDLVVSELRFWDAAGPFTVTTTDLAQRQEALRKSVEGSPLGGTIDRLETTMCLGNFDLRELKLRSNNTFVVYEEAGRGTPHATAEVFDGVWVLRSQGTPWSEVELFGRRHREESIWQSYDDPKTTATDRISGGKLEIARVADLGPEKFWELMKAWRAKGAKDRADCLLKSDRAERFQWMTERGGIVVRGAALTDVFTTN